MVIPSHSLRNPERLAALRRSGLLDRSADEGFDRLTRLASRFLDAPIAGIVLVDGTRQLFKSVVGLTEPWTSTREMPLSESVCRHVVEAGTLVLIRDTREDPRSRDLPVLRKLGVCAFAGVPLVTSDGYVLGGLCVLDTKPRDWTQAEISALEDLAAAASTEIELRSAIQIARESQGRAEAAEADFRGLVEDLDAIVWEMDAATWRFTFVSQRAEAILGYPVEQWCAEPTFWQDRLLHPEDREWAIRFCQRCSEEECDHDFEYRAVAADGRVVWLQDRVRVLPDPDGRGRRLGGVMVDITERKQAESALRLAKEQQDAVLNHIPDAAWLKNREGRYLAINATGARLFGQSPEDLAGKTDFELFPPDLAERFVEEDRRAVQGGALVVGEQEIRGPEGLRTWEILKVPYRDGAGEIAGTAGIARDVTERRRAEETLRASARSYRSLFSSITELVYVLDFQGRFLDVNEAVLRRYGYTREEIVGSLPHLLADPEWTGRDEAIASLRRAAEGEPQHFEWWARTKSGETFLKDVSLTRGEYFGEPVVIAVGRDITERKRAEGALRESEERFRQLAENANAVFWLYDFAERRTIYISPPFEAIWGRPRAALYLDSRAWVEALHAEDRERVVANMDATREQEYETEYRIIRLDGEVRWIRDRGFPIRDAEGRAYRTAGIAEDVTERKRAEAELAAAEAHYRRLVENAPYAVYALDREGRFTELNQASVEILGRDPAELLGQSITQVVAPEDLPEAADSLRRKLSGEVETSDLELRLVHASGEYRLVHIRATAIRQDSEIIGTHGIVRDITEERAREEEMRLLATALESLEEGVSVTTFTGDILYANEKHARLLGYDPAGGAWPPRQAFVPDADEAQRQEEIFRTVAAEGKWVGRTRRRRLDDGRIVPLEAIVGRVVRQKGPSVMFSILRDVTEEIDREKRLRRAERLAGVGTLIGGVAHELNNPLAAIKGFTELLLLDSRAKEEREDLETIRREADRMAKIVSNLKTVARETQGEDEGKREAVDLNEIARHVLKVRRYPLETHNIEVREDLDERLPRVWVNRSEAEQVVLNLIVNAEQALASNGEEGRRLTVRTHPCRIGAALHVVDNGPGIAPEHLERIFDPFFTTKAPGEGTGLGLSLVHSMVVDAGGEIRVESEPGHGAAFMVDLPLAPGLEPKQAPQHVQEVTSVLGLRILVVDDEEAIRRSLSRFLSRRGHRVDTAAEGGEALRLLESAAAGEPYDVILSDLRMPGLSGEELLRRLREQGGGLAEQVIFMTGDAASESAARFLRTAGVPAIEKPLEFAETAERIERFAATRMTQR